MRVIKKKTLRKYWEQHPEAKSKLEAWLDTDSSKNEDWSDSNEAKRRFPNGSYLPENNRFVFRLGGLRLIAHIKFNYSLVYIKWIGKHEDYEKVDPNEVDAY